VSTLLVIEHLDIVEQLLCGEGARFEALTQLDLERREPALHCRIVVAVALSIHAAGDAALLESATIVLPRIRGALVRVVEQPQIWSASAQRHFERA
jgi:hypothetical protein